MNISSPQSWQDLPLAEPMDPRSIIQFVSLDDNTGTPIPGSFLRSTSWFKTAWAASPLSLSIAPTTPPSCGAISPQDFESMYAAMQWNSSHQIVNTSTSIPPSISKLMFLKAGSAFSTTIYLDFAAGVTSTDIQLSFRDNSATSGDMNSITSGSGSVPVFSFASAGHTFGGTNRKLTIATPRAGRYSMCLRVIDNTSLYSMFEMEWNIVP